ncbi:MAG: hypothetical protein B7Y99_10315 [Caulobacterales bacterium 32-69-10]|nr:MAG: hypothetical protein B7Y99_10315 [Caulobacterales bacterium 32-69-10]
MIKTNKILVAAVAAVTLAGGIAAASDASAQGRYRRGGGNTGAAVAAGIAGLAVGAALASNRGYGYGYGPGFNGGYYGPGPVYGGFYGRPIYGPPARFVGPGYYGGRGYYGGVYGRGVGRACVFWDYDRWGRPFQVRGRC